MALPLNSTPVYNLTVPSTKDQIKFKPFLVKDQKALLIAQQSENTQIMMDTLKQIIRNSVTSKIDIDSLSLFDIEYIFMQLRAKSVGEEIEITLKCPENHGTEEDDKKARTDVKIMIDDIKVDFHPEHTNKIHLFGDVGVVMKYPSLETLSKFQTINGSSPEVVFDIMAESMDYVYNNDEIFKIKDQTKAEVKEFIDNLTTEQFDKLQTFFKTMPKLTHTVNYGCPICGKHNQIKLEGLDSFF